MDSDSYSFNFRSMEDTVTSSYLSYKEDPCEGTRTDLFESIRKIAYGVICVGKHKKEGLDFEEIAYEYAIYLYERIVTKTFIPKIGDRFPWNIYIQRNINHIIYKMRWEIDYAGLADDFDEVLRNVKSEEALFLHTNKTHVSTPTKMFRQSLGNKIYDTLKLFYTESEIYRLYHICSDVIFNTRHGYIKQKLPLDMYDFSITFISIAKRLYHTNNIKFTASDISISNLKKAINSSVKSTIFLAAIANADFFTKELLLALDIDSLYRLVSIAGGKTLRIPSFNELDTLIGATSTVSKMALENRTFDEALNDTKYTYNLIFSNKVNLELFVSNLITSMNLKEKVNETEPVINFLVKSINSINSISQTLIEREDETSHEFMLTYYKELMGSLTTLSEFLLLAAKEASSPSSGVLTEDTRSTTEDDDQLSLFGGGI